MERFFLLILTPIFYHLEEDSERYGHVMQDGATTHTSNNSTNALAEVFLWMSDKSHHLPAYWIKFGEIFIYESCK